MGRRALAPPQLLTAPAQRRRPLRQAFGVMSEQQGRWGSMDKENSAVKDTEQENKEQMEYSKERSQRIQRRRQTRLHGILTRGLILSLVIAGLLNIFRRDTRFSQAENRMMAQRPRFTLEAVMSGKYMSDFESYVSDQFFLRNQWISLKLLEDKLLGKRESNGVYLGKKGYLMEKPDTPDWNRVEKNAQAISAFAQRHGDLPVYMCLVPNAFYVMKSKMPAYAPIRDQQADISRVMEMTGGSVRWIDVVRILEEHSEEPLYYKTDHHWKSLGAFYAFQEIAAGMGIPDLETEYNVHRVTNTFEGTLSSKSGDHGSLDSIEVYQPKNKTTDYIVTYVEEGNRSPSVYDSSRLKEKDKYTVFFGGNHARVDIRTTLDQKRNLLIFKDSYANCLVPFLLPYYQKIIMVDPRYFYDNVDQLVENNSITQVLYLYNVNTFLGDASLADVLLAEE